MIEFNYVKTKNKYMSNYLSITITSTDNKGLEISCSKHYYSEKIKNAWILWNKYGND